MEFKMALPKLTIENIKTSTPWSKQNLQVKKLRLKSQKYLEDLKSEKDTQKQFNIFLKLVKENIEGLETVDGLYSPEIENLFFQIIYYSGVFNKGFNIKDETFTKEDLKWVPTGNVDEVKIPLTGPYIGVYKYPTHGEMDGKVSNGTDLITQLLSCSLRKLFDDTSVVELGKPDGFNFNDSVTFHAQFPVEFIGERFQKWMESFPTFEYRIGEHRFKNISELFSNLTVERVEDSA